jgi:hypothetical protein
MPQLLYPLRPVGVVALLGYTSSDDRIGEKSPAPAVLQGRCGLALKPQGPSERMGVTCVALGRPWSCGRRLGALLRAAKCGLGKSIDGAPGPAARLDGHDLPKRRRGASLHVTLPAHWPLQRIDWLYSSG